MSRLIKISQYYNQNILPRISNFRGATYLSRKIQNIALLRISKQNNDNKGTSYSVNINESSVNFRNLRDLRHYLIEEHQTNEILKELGTDSVFYDIGSYHGYYAILAGIKAEVYAFEMATKNFEILEENVSLNPNKDIKIFEKAIWSSNTILNASTDQKSRSTIKKSANHKVESVKLDKFASNYNEPDIIKIDVEGAELEVLKGAKNILKREKPVIFIEIHPESLKNDFNSSKKEIIAFLKNLGYEKEYQIQRGNELQAKFV